EWVHVQLHQQKGMISLSPPTICNSAIECDHGKLKRIIGATLGFKSMKTAYATIKGIEVMRALRKGQASAFYYGDPLGEMRLVSRVFEM
ncbi:transposase, partial [Escherichia coli]